MNHVRAPKHSWAFVGIFWIYALSALNDRAGLIRSDCPGDDAGGL